MYIQYGIFFHEHLLSAMTNEALTFMFLGDANSSLRLYEMPPAPDLPPGRPSAFPQNTLPNEHTMSGAGSVKGKMVHILAWHAQLVTSNEHTLWHICNSLGAAQGTCAS